MFPPPRSTDLPSAAQAKPSAVEDSDNWDPARETHREWSQRRILEAQRHRRAQLRRIDYYVSDEVAQIIDAQRRPGVGGDASSILDRIVLEWAARSGISQPVRARARGPSGIK